VLDSDVPWIPTVSRPRPDAVIHHIDVDPLKQQMPLWHIPARQVFRADVALALRQINAAFDARSIERAMVAERTEHYATLHRGRAAGLDPRERPSDGMITPELLTASVRRHLDDGCVVLNEGITSYHTICNHLRLSRPGAMLASGGGSLGWNGGAAIGAKLA